MEEEQNQKELFKFEEPKKPFAKLTSMLPKRDFEGKVVMPLTLEKIIFISIGIVMAMVLVFALGVERGKARPLGASSGAETKARALQLGSGVPAQNSFLNTAPAVSVAQVKAKSYTIAAAAFSKKETALAAAAFLTKNGHNAFVVYSAPYYRVCVGTYPDMYSVQVQRDLAKVKRIYKDAFIKVR